MKLTFTAMCFLPLLAVACGQSLSLSGDDLCTNSDIRRLVEVHIGFEASDTFSGNFPGGAGCQFSEDSLNEQYLTVQFRNSDTVQALRERSAPASLVGMEFAPYNGVDSAVVRSDEGRLGAEALLDACGGVVSAASGEIELESYVPPSEETMLALVDAIGSALC